MDLQKLQRLVSQGEGGHLEFKKKINSIERILKEVVAFANTSGGTMLLGINDDGTITGLKFYEDDAIVFEDGISRLCEPEIEYEKEVIKVDTKRYVLKYNILEGDDKPYFLLESQNPLKKVPYVRIEDKSMQASPELMEIIIRSRSGEHFSFTYGEKEKALLQYLEKHGSITVEQFQDLVDLPKQEASEVLVNLVLSKILDILPDGNGDRFILKNNVEDTSHSYIYRLN